MAASTSLGESLRLPIALRLVRAALLVALALVLVPSALKPGELPCQRDLLDFFLPMKVQFATAVAGGHLPWWDPLTLGGTPFFANLQSQVLYPPNWIHVFVALPWSLSLYLLFHLLTAGLGARVLARELGTSVQAAWLAGLAFMGGGFVVSLLDLCNQLCATSLMPWTCASALWWARARSTRSVAAWSAAVALSVLSAEPQQAALGGAFSAAFAACACASQKTGTRAKAGAALGVLAVAMQVALLALLATSVQVLPFAQLVLRSDRLGVEEAYAAGGRNALAPADLVTFVTPPSHAHDAPAGPYLGSLHAGLFVVALALAGLLRGRGPRGLLLGALVVSLGLAMVPHVPLLGAAYLEATPWLRYPIKNAVIAALVLPLLAAMGWDALRLHFSRQRVACLVLALLPLLTAAELGVAHHGRLLTLPADSLLSPTDGIRLIAAQVHSRARLHAMPLTQERLRHRAALVARGHAAEAERERVELLEGGLPAIFGIAATYGAAALTDQAQAALLSRADGPMEPEIQARLHAAFLVDAASRSLPLVQLPVDGGAAKFYLLPGSPARATCEWEGPNRVQDAPGSAAPSSYPGWREGPPGTWTFRPTALVPLACLSLATWILLGAMFLCRPMN